MRATSAIYNAAGRPDPRKPVHDASGACYWCAGDVLGRACRQRDVCGSSFTDHDVAAVPTSPWVCCACAWTMTGRPPDTLRLWSLLWVDGAELAPSHEKAPQLGPSIHLQNKADPSLFMTALCCPPDRPWAMAVADSGQIHVIPHAVVNFPGDGGWRVRFERVDVVSTTREFRDLHSVITDLIVAGFSKTDIAGEPSIGKLARCGIDVWRRADKYLSRYRGGAVLDLALFLTRKERE